MAKAGTIRGLQVFISDIRACQNKEQETRRVDKELAKIRGKFGDEKKALTGEAVLLAAGMITIPGSRTLLTETDCIWCSLRPQEVCMEAAVHLHAGLRCGVWTQTGL